MLQLKVLVQSFLVISVLLAPAVQASQGNDSLSFFADEQWDIFQPEEKDISIAYLAMLFGETGGPEVIDQYVVGKQSFVGAMMSIFNSGLLILGFILLLYHVVIITYDSGRSGRFLGERGSLWLPVRAAVGIVMLFPAGQGYCLAQALALYFVTAGVGLADTLWREVYLYMTFAPNTASAETDLRFNSLQNMLKDQRELQPLYEGVACMALMKVYLGVDDVAAVATLSASSFDANEMMVNFGPADDNPNADCRNLYISGYPNNSELANAYVQTANDLLPEAVAITSDIQSNYPNISKSADYPIPDQTASNVVSVFSVFEILYDNAVLEAAAVNDNFSQAVADMNDRIQYGWLTAGMYFRLLLKLQNGADPNSIRGEGNVDLRGGETKDNELGYSGLKRRIVSEILDKILQQEYASNPTTAAGGDVLSNFKNEIKDTSDLEGDRKTRYEDFLYIADKIADNSGLDIFKYDPDQERYIITDPFSQAVEEGNVMMVHSLIVNGSFIAFFAFLNFLGQIASAYIPVGWMFEAATNIGQLFLTVMFGIIYGLGSLLAIVLPLVPSVIFLVGSIGWFLVAFMCVISAPIVALGLIWPDKNQSFMGKAGPAIILYLNVLLRPALMIIGLFAGVLLCSIGFFLVISAFSIALQSGIIAPDTAFLLGGQVYGLAHYGQLPIIFATVLLLIAIAQQSFLLIVTLPDNVLRWIGGQSSLADVGGAGGAFSAEAATRDVQQSADEGTKTAIRATEEATEYAQRFADSAAEKAADKMTQIVQGGSSASGEEGENNNPGDGDMGKGGLAGKGGLGGKEGEMAKVGASLALGVPVDGGDPSALGSEGNSKGTDAKQSSGKQGNRPRSNSMPARSNASMVSTDSSDIFSSNDNTDSQGSSSKDEPFSQQAIKVEERQNSAVQSKNKDFLSATMENSAESKQEREEEEEGQEQEENVAQQKESKEENSGQQLWVKAQKIRENLKLFKGNSKEEIADKTMMQSNADQASQQTQDDTGVNYQASDSEGLVVKKRSPVQPLPAKVSSAVDQMIANQKKADESNKEEAEDGAEQGKSDTKGDDGKK